MIDRPFSIFCTGFFLSALLVCGIASAEAKSIAKDQVNIREKPDLNSAILYTAPLGYPIEIKKEEKGWVYFHDWLDNSGWVHKPLVSDIDTAVILVEKANIRGSASASANVVASAEQGEIYTILAKEGDWVKLGYYQSGTAVGWIRNDLVFGD
ncbi:MAG: SH3 domain-containing protein [Desulfobulbus sp.]|jgi:SH3-like domain-containing protein|uniref:SH3 domain-containing protein n=1 Tax=Desulfobulbus sp. TaxID=895 RepID=UPI0028428773|nr:SH3 domain-containing protein [Desulfobulbus sp.]MDR2549692.1 SH3 domain-containing protein [Desulfobulbus sp.]